MPAGWRAQATWPTQDLVKHVKRTVATTSESSQLPPSSSSPGCSEAQPDNRVEEHVVRRNPIPVWLWTLELKPTLLQTLAPIAWVVSCFCTILSKSVPSRRNTAIAAFASRVCLAWVSSPLLAYGSAWYRILDTSGWNSVSPNHALLPQEKSLSPRAQLTISSTLIKKRELKVALPSEPIWGE